MSVYVYAAAAFVASMCVWELDGWFFFEKGKYSLCASVKGGGGYFMREIGIGDTPKRNIVADRYHVKVN